MAWIEMADEGTETEEKDLSGTDTKKWQKNMGKLPS
jgi:hypothetical protein